MLLLSGFTTELKHFDVCIYYVQYVNLELFSQIPAEKQAINRNRAKFGFAKYPFEVSGDR